MEHKYSTVALLVLGSVIIVSAIIVALESSEVDELCATNNQILKRVNGTWVCSDDLTGNGTSSSNISDTNISVTRVDFTGVSTIKLTLEQKDNNGNALPNVSDTFTFITDEYPDEIQFTGVQTKTVTLRSTGFNFSGNFNDRTLNMNTSWINNNITVKDSKVIAVVQSKDYNTTNEMNIDADNKKFCFGADQDACMYWNGSVFIIE